MPAHDEGGGNHSGNNGAGLGHDNSRLQSTLNTHMRAGARMVIKGSDLCQCSSKSGAEEKG